MMQPYDAFSNGAPIPWILIGLLIPLMLIDVGLKGWGMWRAAKMGKNIWFIALLIVNSMGVLPIIFLVLTKDEYAKLKK